MYNKWAKYTHKGITLLCDASPLEKKKKDFQWKQNHHFRLVGLGVYSHILQGLRKRIPGISYLSNYRAVTCLIPLDIISKVLTNDTKNRNIALTIRVWDTGAFQEYRWALDVGLVLADIQRVIEVHQSAGVVAAWEKGTAMEAALVFQIGWFWTKKR